MKEKHVRADCVKWLLFPEHLSEDEYFINQVKQAQNKSNTVDKDSGCATAFLCLKRHSFLYELLKAEVVVNKLHFPGEI